MMKSLRLLLWLTVLCSGTVVASAMNNADVIKMVKAGLDDETVILAVGAAKTTEFDLSADGIIELKNKAAP